MSGVLANGKVPTTDLVRFGPRLTRLAHRRSLQTIAGTTDILMIFHITPRFRVRPSMQVADYEIFAELAIDGQDSAVRGPDRAHDWLSPEN